MSEEDQQCLEFCKAFNETANASKYSVVAIPRAQYDAYRTAADVVIDMASVSPRDCDCATCKAAATLRAAGIETEG